MASQLTKTETDKDEEMAIMSLLQFSKAPEGKSSSRNENDITCHGKTEGPAKKKRKTQGRDEIVSGVAVNVVQKTQGQKQPSPSPQSHEKEIFITIHEALLGKTTTKEAANTAQSADVPDEVLSGRQRATAEAPIRSFEKSPFETEMALRNLEKSPLERELALRALEKSSLEHEFALRQRAYETSGLAVGANPYHYLAAPSSAMSSHMFPNPSIAFLHQQRARQIQLENMLLHAQLAAVEQQRLQRLALLTAQQPPRPANTTASAMPETTEKLPSPRSEPVSQPTVPSLPQKRPATPDTDTTEEEPAKIPVKPAMKPSSVAKKPENQRLCTRTKFRYEHYTPPPSWSELTDVPKIAPVPADDDMQFPIEIAGENDVLLGRGGATNMHKGNIKFRNLVQRYRTAYCTVPKGDKGALARFLCNYVRAKKGRFLRQDPSDKKWYEVGDEKAIGKCGQALREGSAEYIKTNKNGHKCGVPMEMFVGAAATKI